VRRPAPWRGDIYQPLTLCGQEWLTSGHLPESHHATILIVYDDSVQRRLLAAMARRFVHDAIVADGGEAAIKALGDGSETRVDCMVLGLVIPDLDGVGVLARVREAGIAIPVIGRRTP
jgi:DNA-binding NtrC family response regulator